MTDDPRELARRARVAKFEKLKQHAQITTAAELLAKHKLPASVAEIEAGEGEKLLPKDPDGGCVLGGRHKALH